MAKTKLTYRAQWYESDESLAGPYAVTPDEQRWVPTDTSSDTASKEDALLVAADWTTNGKYKTSRVIELEDGEPVSVIWMSVWEAPISASSVEGGAGTGQPGESIKLLVWMDRDQPLDHYDFQKKLGVWMEGNNNWDLVYARPTDTRGKMVQYSVRLNLWIADRQPSTKWDWWTIFGKDPETQRDEIEIVRATEIGPRGFPDGVDTVGCTFCGKTVEKAKSWGGWDDEQDKMVPFCSCRCIDEMHDTDWYREDPDGIEHEGPGCVCLVTSAA